ncbi:MAG TPA: hypothetical protein VMB24_03655 [Dehalococcoidales bacterium]|nr:hypothetical protein [Dehalococcoidales bacterium]
MATRKHNNIFLILALLCFLGIVAIFIFDGYIGVYDTLAVNNGQYTQTVTPDQWGQPERYGGSFNAGIPGNGSATFTYTMENHRFNKYNSRLDATLVYNEQIVLNLFGRDISIPAFGKQSFEWTLSAADVPMQYRNVVGTIKIVSGNIQRQVGLNIYETAATKSASPIPTITITLPPR